MAAARKKRAKPRAKVKAPTRPAVLADLKELDSEWRTFITQAANQKPLAAAWPDPKGISLKKAGKKVAARKTTRTARKKTVGKKAA